MRSIRGPFFVFLAIAVSCVGLTHAFSVPEGWRTLAKDEFMNEIRKEEQKDYLAVQADFNGDGADDEARLLVTLDGKKMAIVVWVSNESLFHILGEYEAWPEAMGIDLARIIHDGDEMSANCVANMDKWEWHDKHHELCGVART
jgi:hypothetical protein